jgi:hypothetical protein
LVALKSEDDSPKVGPISLDDIISQQKISDAPSVVDLSSASSSFSISPTTMPTPELKNFEVGIVDLTNPSSVSTGQHNMSYDGEASEKMEPVPSAKRSGARRMGRTGGGSPNLKNELYGPSAVKAVLPVDGPAEVVVRESDDHIEVRDFRAPYQKVLGGLLAVSTFVVSIATVVAIVSYLVVGTVATGNITHFLFMAFASSLVSVLGLSPDAASTMGYDYGWEFVDFDTVHGLIPAFIGMYTTVFLAAVANIFLKASGPWSVTLIALFPARVAFALLISVVVGSVLAFSMVAPFFSLVLVGCFTWLAWRELNARASLRVIRS